MVPFVEPGGPVMMIISLLLSIISLVYSIQDLGAMYKFMAMLHPWLPQPSNDSFRWLPPLSTYLPTGAQRAMMEMSPYVIYASVFTVCALPVLVARQQQEWGRSRNKTWSNEQLQARVRQLPMETWIGQDGRSQANIDDLRARLERRKISTHGVEEKTELVALLESAPHETVCSICYEDFEKGAPVRLLRCGHYFHIGCAMRGAMKNYYRSTSQHAPVPTPCWWTLPRCIDRWLLSANGARAPSCPLCSRDILARETPNETPTT